MSSENLIGVSFNVCWGHWLTCWIAQVRDRVLWHVPGDVLPKHQLYSFDVFQLTFLHLVNKSNLRAFVISLDKNKKTLYHMALTWFTGLELLSEKEMRISFRVLCNVCIPKKIYASDSILIWSTYIDRAYSQSRTVLELLYPLTYSTRRPYEVRERLRKAKVFSRVKWLSDSQCWNPDTLCREFTCLYGLVF